ncbi:MAG: SMR family transporter [Thiobacillus sp.]|nr:SMR family transporter [Thiobacillus sp.]
MNWWILVVAGILEVGWAIGLKYTEGFMSTTVSCKGSAPATFSDFAK